ncbi:MAG: glycosyltransferase [Candidatus Latescibacterota bacterium]
MLRKIMFVSSIMRYGGGERWMLDAALGMQGRGHRVRLVSRPGSVLGDTAKAAGIDCATVEMRGDLDPAAICRLTGLVRSFRPDAVIPNLDREIRLCGLAIFFAGRRQQWRARPRKRGTRLIPRRGSEFPLKNNSHYRFFYTHFVHSVIANSHATQRTMLSATPWFARDRVHVIHNGIDLQKHDRLRDAAQTIRREIRDSLNIPHDVPVVALIGELNERKGQQHVIEASDRILSEYPAARIIFVGEGDAKESLERTLSEKNLRDNFLLTGFRDDIPEILCASDMLILPSRVEGFGYVLIEAMAAGLPVVASRISSMPEIVVDEETGFLHEVANIDQIGECICRLIGDRDLSSKMGAAGRARVESEFNLDVMLDRLEEVL